MMVAQLAVPSTGGIRERLTDPVRDGLAVAGRNLIALVRVPGCWSSPPSSRWSSC